MMWRNQLLLIVMVGLVVLAAAGSKKNKKEGKCEWVNGPCVAKSGDCGEGTLTKTREGEGCKKTRSKNVSCEISCSDGTIDTKSPVKKGRGNGQKKPAGFGRFTDENGCAYKVEDRGECEDGTRQLKYVLDEKKMEDKSVSCEEEVTKEIKCRSGKAEGRKKRPNSMNRCKYDKGEWTECGSDGLIKRTDTLRANSPTECKPTRTNSRTCTQAESLTCRYVRGRWSPCRTGDKGYQERVRVDTLRRKSPSSCPQSRSISKECYERSPLKCHYDAGEWSDCVDNMRTLNKTLLSGPSDKCEAHLIKQRKCTDEDGKELCFYGPWGEIPSCEENGDDRVVERPLVAGDATTCTETTKTLRCKSRGRKHKSNNKSKNKGSRENKRSRKNRKNKNDKNSEE